MLKKLMGKLQNEEGQALVEYGLLVALIAVVCIAVLILLGGEVRNNFCCVTSAL